MASDTDSLLVPGGMFSAEDLAAARSLSGQTQSAGPTVWLPEKKRKYRDYAEQSGSGDRVYEKGRLQPAKDHVTEPERDESADVVATWVYDPQKRQEILAYLKKRGIQVNSFDDLEKIWQQAVGRASDAYEGSGKTMKTSPFDMLDLVAPEKDSGPSPVKGLEWTSTSENVDMAEMPPEVAKAALQGSLREILGRDPTDEEINDFASRAAAIAAENPYTRTTSTTRKWDPELEQYIETGSKTTESGVSQEELNARMQSMATEETEATSEAGTYEAATRGMNALMEILG